MTEPADPRPPFERYAPPPWYFDDPRADVAALLPPHITGVLDVGCGSGAFLSAVSASRPTVSVVGIEADAEAADAARTAGLDVRHAAFPDGLDDLPSDIDCVVFNDVVEHLVDPWSALAAAADVVGAGGWLVVSLPNLRNLDTLRELVLHGDFRYRSHGVLDVTHLRFFTQRSARRLLEESGFDVRSIHPIGRLRSRKSNAVATAVGVVVPWLRREGRFRQFVLIATPTRTRPSTDPQRRPSRNQP